MLSKTIESDRYRATAASFVYISRGVIRCVVKIQMSSALYQYEITQLPQNMAASAESRGPSHLPEHISVLEITVYFYSLHIAVCCCGRGLKC